MRTLEKHAEFFLLWCEQYHNSPDIINLRFWIEERSGLLEWDDDFPGLLLAEVQQQKSMPSSQESVDEDSNLGDTNHSRKDGTDDMTRRRNAKGRPAADTLLKEINPKTLQGRIISFVMDFSDDIKDVMREFQQERNAIMSHLNVVSKSSGIGYSVTGDTINITLPAGVVDPFELSF